MKKLIVGGNTIQEVDLKDFSEKHLTEDPYWLFHVRAQKSVSKFRTPGSMSILMMEAPKGLRIKALGSEQSVSVGDVVQFENAGEIAFEGGSGPIEFYAAGTVKSAERMPKMVVTAAEAVKKVVKPWGHELWLNGEHPNYAFKKIFIKAGTKTSLQYHRMKRETMIFCEGDAALHYKSNPEANNDELTPKEVSSVPIRPGHLVDVFPNHIHRVEAVSDILLIEVSTPHLDDVIRVSDDTNRVNGRIATEHSLKELKAK